MNNDTAMANTHIQFMGYDLYIRNDIYPNEAPVIAECLGKFMDRALERELKINELKGKLWNKQIDAMYHKGLFGVVYRFMTGAKTP
jgi:hypothetical protein